MTGSGKNDTCWCSTEKFPNEIFELVPAESNRRHCICKKCLVTFKKEQKIIERL
jgi:Cysteine-rich CWC